MANLYLSNRIAPKDIEDDAFVASSEVIEYEGNESVKSALRRALLNGGGSQGEKGDKGDKGNTPMLRIDENGYWVVSYDNGQTWEPLNVKASGEDGEDGEDAPTPIFELRGGHLFVSLDNRGSWVDLGKVTGADGVNGKTVEFIFYRYNDRPLPEDKYPSNDWGYDAPQNGWTDNAQGVTAALKYEYVSMRYVELVNNVLISKGDWSVPSIWAVYSDATISDEDLQRIIDDAKEAAIAGASGAINTALGDIDQAKKDLEDANKRLGELADQMKDLEDADNGLGARISEDRDRMTIIEQDCDSIRSTASSGHYLTNASGEFVNEEGHTLVYFYISGGADQYYFWENESPFVWYDSEKEEFYRLADGVKDVVDRPENYDYQSCGIDVVLKDENEVEYFAKDDAILVIDAFSDLKQTSKGISARVANNEGKIATLELTSEKFGATLESFKEGLSGAITRIGTLEASASGISERVTSLEENEDNYLLKSAQQDITADAIRGVVTGTDFTNVQAAIQNLQKDLAETTVMDGRYLTREENGVTLYVDENDYVIYAIDFEDNPHEIEANDGDIISTDVVYEKDGYYYVKEGGVYKDASDNVISYAIHPLGKEDNEIFTNYAVLIVDALSNIKQTSDSISLTIANFKLDDYAKTGDVASIVMDAINGGTIRISAENIDLKGKVSISALTDGELEGSLTFRDKQNRDVFSIKPEIKTRDQILGLTETEQPMYFSQPLTFGYRWYPSTDNGSSYTYPIKELLFNLDGDTGNFDYTLESKADRLYIGSFYCTQGDVVVNLELRDLEFDFENLYTEMQNDIQFRIDYYLDESTTSFASIYYNVNTNDQLVVPNNYSVSKTFASLSAGSHKIYADAVMTECNVEDYGNMYYNYIAQTEELGYIGKVIFTSMKSVSTKNTEMLVNGFDVVSSTNNYIIAISEDSGQYFEVRSGNRGIEITPTSAKIGLGDGTFYNMNPLYAVFHLEGANSGTGVINSSRKVFPYGDNNVRITGYVNRKADVSTSAKGYVTVSLDRSIGTNNVFIQLTPYNANSGNRNARIPQVASWDGTNLTLNFLDDEGVPMYDAQCICDVFIYKY